MVLVLSTFGGRLHLEYDTFLLPLDSAGLEYSWEHKMEDQQKGSWCGGKPLG